LIRVGINRIVAAAFRKFPLFINHAHPSCRRCALRTYIALSASSSALLTSA
jgi:hypothetical protein